MGEMGWLLHIITSDYGSFPHSLLSSSKRSKNELEVSINGATPTIDGFIVENPMKWFRATPILGNPPYRKYWKIMEN